MSLGAAKAAMLGAGGVGAGGDLYRYLRIDIPASGGGNLFLEEAAYYTSTGDRHPNAAMTGANTPVPLVATGSGGEYGFAPWKLFDRLAAYWYAKTPLDEFVTVDLGSELFDPVGGHLDLKAQSLDTSAPETLSVSASKTGAFAGEEVVLYTSGALTWASNETKTFSF